MLSVLCVVSFFFFFKQKTAYEMRISDWSSDVCASDLDADDGGARLGLAVEDLPLGLHVAVEPAVTIDVVRRDVHQHRDVEGDREGELELVGRHLQHVDAALVQRLQGEGRDRKSVV